MAASVNRANDKAASKYNKRQNNAKTNISNKNNSSITSLRRRLAQFFSSCKSLTTSSTKGAKKSDQYQSNNNIHTPNFQNMNLSPRSFSLNDLTSPNPSNWTKPLVSDNVITIRNGTIQICRGDITKQMVDVIVIASSSDYLRNNVLQQAGDPIKAAYDAEQRCNMNKSICTNGGNLACKRIYFIPCPQISQHTDKWVFRKFISKAILLAKQDNTIAVDSIGIPAIGCGKYGCDSDFVAKTLIMAIVYELEQQPSLHLNVYFVIQQHQQKVFDSFRNELMTLKNNTSAYRSSQSCDIVAHQPPNPPRHYNNNNNFDIEKRLIDKSSSQYTKVVNEFSLTMKSQPYTKIVRVELVWNKCWYDQYMTHKNAFSQRLQEDTEKHLFHGCSEDAANSIVKTCFDRSHAGKNGTSYGYGVYFSSRASYSHSYAIPNKKGERCMFLAKVLIGRTTVGNSSMKICPNGYDSTTDGSHIYVTYHDAQAFGQYLITYIQSSKN